MAPVLLLNLDTFHTLLQSCLEGEITQIGQVTFTKGLCLFHTEDAARSDLCVYTEPEAAGEIARFDDVGQYRPLKSAPNLRHGWELRLSSIKELHVAIDFLYPAALGLWLSLLRRQLVGTSLRRTLERQSGMYRIAVRTTDEQAKGLIRDFCEKKCLRKILWGIHCSAVAWQEESNVHKIPLLCSEACNLFVAAARRVVKAAAATP
ncbi:hypothetical protein AMD24_00761 [Candidatus Xiphinematobacter sp. Idaho Grape]|uniref:DR2241 family protein n=1 Tax=Candidatus Xiphinematobacter sp. Idaho Grape TaxID=1704307 RepID=UPI0007059519|nr:DR2241 family protein [Candidatus Xiphinematobacter sp. Idaho Grape]ALJ56921.1 hypothetical protein AMD24_00761 [Candidatus Xiphinematobacter sp. Idaho Grape]